VHKLLKCEFSISFFIGIMTKGKVAERISSGNTSNGDNSNNGNNKKKSRRRRRSDDASGSSSSGAVPSFLRPGEQLRYIPDGLSSSMSSPTSASAVAMFKMDSSPSHHHHQYQPSSSSVPPAFDWSADVEKPFMKNANDVEGGGEWGDGSYPAGPRREHHKRRVSHSQDTWDQRLEVAAQYIRDALHGRKAHDLDVLESSDSSSATASSSRALLFHRLFHSSLYRNFIILVVCAHTLLINFEIWSTLRHVDGTAHLSHSESASIEVIFIVVYMFDLYLFCRRYGTSELLRPRSWGFMQLVITLLMFIDVLIAYSTSFRSFRFSRPFRGLLLVARLRNVRKVLAGCVRAFRPVAKILALCLFNVVFFAIIGYLVFSWYGGDLETLKGSMYALTLVYSAPPRMLDVLHMYYDKTKMAAVFFVVFGIVGRLFLFKLVVAVSFASYKTHTKTQTLKRLNRRKKGILAAWDHLIVGGRPEEAAIFDASRRATITAAVSTISDGQRRGSSLEITQMGSEGGVDAAAGLFPVYPQQKASNQDHDPNPASFCIDEGAQGLLPEDYCIDVILRVRPDLSWEDGYLLYASIDAEKRGKLSFKQFYDLCALSDAQVEVHSGRFVHAVASGFARCLASLSILRPSRRRDSARQDSLMRPLNADSRTSIASTETDGSVRGAFIDAALARADAFVEKMREFLYTKRSILTIDLLVILSVVQLIMVAKLDSPQGNKDDGGWVALGSVLLVVFLIEMIMKMICFGVRGYFFSVYNKVDFVCVVVSTLYHIWMLFSDTDQIQFFKFALAIRVLRLLKLLDFFKTWSDLMSCVTAICSPLVRIGFVLFTVIYFFSVIGMELFAGKLSPDNASCPGLRNSTWWEFREELNFDGFNPSLLTMYVVSFLSNWPISMDAAVIVENGELWPRYFFFFFHVLFSMVFLPILVGFIVHAFISHAARPSLSQVESERGVTYFSEERGLAVTVRRKRRNSETNYAVFNDFLSTTHQNLERSKKMEELAAKLTSLQSEVDAKEAQIDSLREQLDAMR